MRIELLGMYFVFLANRVGKILAMNLYGYTIIGYTAANRHEEYKKAKMSFSSLPHLLISPDPDCNVHDSHY